MNNPLVSIIVPVYNTGTYLSQCITSILNQTYREIELILVDDGSKDNSLEICEGFAMQDSRVRVYHKANEGVSIARNYALDRASGEWIFFCDSDDWLEYNAIERCSNYFATNDFIRFSVTQVFIDKAKYIDSPKIIDKQSYLHNLISRNVRMGVCGGVYRKSLFENNNIRFNHDIYMGEDWHVLARIAFYCSSPTSISDSLYYYNRTSEISCVNNVSIKKWLNCFYALNLIADFYKNNSRIDFSNAFKNAKVKIFYECIGAILNTHESLVLSRKSLVQNNAIPSWGEILKSQTLPKVKIISLLTSCSFSYYFSMYLLHLIVGIKK